MNRVFSCLLSFVFALFLPSLSAAQAYPAKSIRFVIPFAPGGNSDRMARMIGQKLTESWGQPVIIDNRTGAGGTIGADAVAKAPPDGYTLLMGSFGSIGASKGLYKNLPYDPVKDFAPVTLIATPPLLLLIHPSLPVDSVKGLLAIARSKPGELTFASSGNGSSNHLIGELFNKMAKINLTHIPYKGASPALTDVMAGRVHVMFVPVAPALAQIQAGKLKPIAVTAAKRLASMPAVPTVAESGVPGFEASGWDGILVPAGTPGEIIAKLNKEIVRILKLPELTTALAREGVDVIASTPERFGAFIKSEVDRWAKLTRELGVTID